MKINEENYEKRNLESFPELTVYENGEEILLVENITENEQAVFYRREK